jgi:hypothetical protein
MNPKALQWITGSDTGISSKTLWAVMMGAVADGDRYDRPYDGADFGRCHRLLELVPEWKPRLAEVAARFPEWGPLVREWSKIEAAYLADLKDHGGRAWKIINGLSDECMKAGGWIKTGAFRWSRAEQ